MSAKMPDRPFSPFIVREQMGPEVFNTRSWTAYPPEQLAEIEKSCAELGFSAGYDAGYLAGLAAARGAVPYSDPFSGGADRDKDNQVSGQIDFRGRTLANITALEKEMQK